MKKKMFTMLSAIFIAGGLNAQIDINATQTVKNLYGNLKEVAWDTKGILFGQEFFNSLSWPNNIHEDENFSDIKSVTGKHPAVLGQDFLFYLTKSSDERRKHKEAALKAYNLGCVIEFCNHLNSKNHSGYLYETSDKYLMFNIGNQTDTYGEFTWFKGELDKMVSVINELNIPIVVRPFHEMNGNWFWWGSNAYGGAVAYKKMYQFTVDYIKARTNNVLFSWAPNYPFDITYYPGNTYVDIVGLDLYDPGEINRPSFSTMVSQLEAVSDFAWNNNKVPVFAETGNRVSNPNNYPWWWYNVNQNIQGSNRAFKVAWMLTWINMDWGNPPYVAHNGSSTDAKIGLNDFVNMSTILMQPDAATRNMYNSSTRTSKIRATTKSVEMETESKTISLSPISVYPNPVKEGFFTVNLVSLLGKSVNVIVLDILGNEVMRKNVKDVPILNVPVSELSKGVYLVKISSEDWNETQKIIVQ